jgi:hypothetical protein
VTDPPEWPISLWFLLALLAGGTVYLFVRAVRNERGWGLRAGVVAGSFVALLVPTATAGATQDLTCRDGGVLARPNGALIVACLTSLAVIWLLTMFWVAGDREPGSGRRLSVIPPALIVPVALVELMGVRLPLEDYCDGLRGVLHLQAALALLLPVAALVLASVRTGAPDRGGPRVPAPAVAGALVVVLLAQVVAVSDRFTPDPLACVTRRSLPPFDALIGVDGDPNVVAADFDGDGTVDLAGFDEARSARVYLNDGAGTFTARAGAAPLVNFAPYGVVRAADIDGNGHQDLVVAGTEIAEPRQGRRRSGVVVLLNDGKALTALPPVLVGEDPYLSLTMADLDGDRRVEVIVRSGAGVWVVADRGRALERGPSLTYPAPADTVRPGSWDFEVVDADADGRADILAWASGGLASPSYVVLHRNAGGRTFTSSVVATVPGYLGAVTVADFDGDGDVDLVSNGTRTRQSVVVNQGAGRFDVTSRPARLWASDAHAADIDGDGRLDLVLSIGFVSDVVEEPGFLFVRRNLGDFRFSDAQRLATPRTLLAVADLNGDRRADYVVEESRRVNVLLSRNC